MLQCVAGSSRTAAEIELGGKVIAKATDLLLEAFPELSADGTPVVANLVHQDGSVAIDVMMSI